MPAQDARTRVTITISPNMIKCFFAFGILLEPLVLRMSFSLISPNTLLSQTLICSKRSLSTIMLFPATVI